MEILFIFIKRRFHFMIDSQNIHKPLRLIIYKSHELSKFINDFIEFLKNLIILFILKVAKKKMGLDKLKKRQLMI